MAQPPLNILINEIPSDQRINSKPQTTIYKDNIPGFYMNLTLISSFPLQIYSVHLVCFSIPLAYQAYSGLSISSILPKPSSLRYLQASFLSSFRFLDSHDFNSYLLTKHSVPLLVLFLWHFFIFEFTLLIYDFLTYVGVYTYTYTYTNMQTNKK